MNFQQLIDVGLSDRLIHFERRLVKTADALGFPIISGVLMHGLLHDANVQIASVGNTPPGYLAVAKDLGEARRDPVMARLMTQAAPIVYDQKTYAAAGAGDIWEAQATHGYKTGIAVKLHLPGGRHFLLGVDREEVLPEPGAQLMQMVAGLQLLAAHAVTAAERLLAPRLRKGDLPRLTKRELAVLRWTAQGKTAWEVGGILGMAETTTNFHLGNAMRKLGVTSKYQAVLKCVSEGLL